jgi:hypothetical protein
MDATAHIGSAFDLRGNIGEESPLSVENEAPPNAFQGTRGSYTENDSRLSLGALSSYAPLLVEVACQLSKLRDRLNDLEHQSRKSSCVQDQLGALANQVAVLEERLRQHVLAREHWCAAESVPERKSLLESEDASDAVDKLAEEFRDQFLDIRAFELRLTQAINARFLELYRWTESQLTRLEERLASIDVDGSLKREMATHAEQIGQKLEHLESGMRSCISREEWSRERDALEKHLRHDLGECANRNASSKPSAPTEQGTTSTSVALDAMRSVMHLQSTVEGNARAVEDALTAVRTSCQALNQRLQRIEHQLTTDEFVGGAGMRQVAPPPDWNQIQQTVRKLESQLQKLSSRLPDPEEIHTAVTQTKELTGRNDQLERRVERLHVQMESERNQRSELEHKVTRLEDFTSTLQSLPAELTSLTKSMTQGDEVLQEWVRGQLQRLDARLHEHESSLHELRAETAHLYEQYAEVAALILLMTPADNRATVERRIRQLLPGLGALKLPASRAGTSEDTR